MSRTSLRAGGILWCLWLCLLAAGTPAWAASGTVLSAHEKADLFAKAKDVFAEGNRLRAGDADGARRKYALATALFERIAREGGVRNGKLYYNVGNSYFLQKKIGEAILNYRRAERLMPRHGDLKKNLKAARILRKDQIETPAKRKVLEVLFFWHYDLSLFARFVLFVVCFNAVWILGILSLLRKDLGLRVPVTVAILLAAALAASTAVEEYSLATTKEGVILAGEVVARKGDGESYSPSFTTPLHEGTEFELLDERGGWFHVRLMDGRTCWVPASSAGLI